MVDKFEPGELFVYTNGNRWELGMVKRPGSGDGYFCWYSRGDTAAFTPTSCMHKLSNAGFTHIEQILDTATVGAVTCEGSFHKSSDLSSGRVPLYYCKDTNRSIFVEHEAKVCPLCGGRIKEEAE